MWIIPIIILLLYMTIETKFLKTTHYEIISKKIKDNAEVKLVLLSDLHNNEFGKHNKRLIERIDKEQPDAILVAGDMLVGYSKADNIVAYELIEKLSKKYTIYYGNGNHEQKLSMYEEEKKVSYNKYIKMLKKQKVHHLVNESTCIKEGKYPYTIYGLEIGQAFYNKFHRPEFLDSTVEECIGKPNTDKFNIVIAHNPMYFKKYAEWGADLVVSGHIHGGIVRLPKFGGVISPQYIFFPEYDVGKFEYKQSTMVVSGGLGMHTLKFRLFNRPELVVINIKASDFKE